MSIKPELTDEEAFERESFYALIIGQIQEEFTFILDKDKPEPEPEQRKKFNSDIYRSKRIDMEVLIRYAQEDLSKGMEPPKEYAQLLTDLLCNYLNDIHEIRTPSDPAKLSKYLYLSGDRSGFISTQYKTMALFFSKGFSEFRGRMENANTPTTSIIEYYRRKEISLSDAFYQEGKKIALSGEMYLKKCDLTELMASYLFKSISTVNKFYYGNDLENSIKMFFAPKKN